MSPPACSCTTVALWGLTLLLLIQQVCASPVPPGEVQNFAPQGSRGVPLRRAVRMTPLWRTIGSKPFGAYCQENFECVSRLCRSGHCSFHNTMKS